MVINILWFLFIYSFVLIVFLTKDSNNKSFIDRFDSRFIKLLIILPTNIIAFVVLVISCTIFIIIELLFIVLKKVGVLR